MLAIYKLLWSHERASQLSWRTRVTIDAALESIHVFDRSRPNINKDQTYKP